jgi:hypothetical protein
MCKCANVQMRGFGQPNVIMPDLERYDYQRTSYFVFRTSYLSSFLYNNFSPKRD